MTNRFMDWGGSESEGTDSESGSDNAAIENTNQGGNRFEFDSSSSEEEKRVVRSAKDKRFEAILNAIATLKHHINSSDYVGVNKDFDGLQKLLIKAKNIVRKEGVPKFYVKAMLSIKTTVEAVVKAKKANKDMKMNPSNSKAINGLKQKLKKFEKKNKNIIEAYLKDPLVSEEEKEEFSDSDSDSDSNSDSDNNKAPVSNIEDSKQDSFDNKDGGSDSSDWDDQSGSDSDSDSDLDLDNIPTGGIQYTRAYWMKKPEDVVKDKTKEANREERRRLRTAAREAKKEAKTVQAKEKKEEKVYTPEMILTKLKELLSMRGKRGTDRKSLIADLELLSTKATEAAAVLKVKVALASAYFEINLNKGVSMKADVWKKCHKVLLDMLCALSENPNVRLSEDRQDVEESFEGEEDEDSFLNGIVTGAREKKVAPVKEEEEEEEETEDDGITWVKGNFYSFLYRLSTEFTKSLPKTLQEMNYHNQSTTQYVVRLRDEGQLTSLCTLCAAYYKSIGKTALQAQVILIQLEHRYSYLQPEYDYNHAKVVAFESKGEEKVESKDPAGSDVISFCTFLYKNGDVRQRTRALLAHLYFLSHHNWFERARDLLLMSHVQDGINEADIKTRILFNRVMAQLGLCAFRTGHYYQGMSCLADLHQSQRIRELLAQGISSSRYHERDEKQEKIEKKRQFPFHLHMHLDTLETVHLLGAMFAEVENITLGKRKIINKIFRRQYDIHKNNFFNAPPENTRDLIMHATKNLQQGYWRVAIKSIMNLRLWNSISYPEFIKDHMTKEIKETALRMYLMTYGASYVSVSMASLIDMFELPDATINRVVSKMMMNGHLQAVWDQPTKTLVIHTSQPSRLQRVALTFADKALVFVEQNERLLDQRHGYYNGKGGGKGWKGKGKGKGKGNYNNYRR